MRMVLGSLLVSLALLVSWQQSARADNVGAVIGAVTGTLVAGPVGLVGGLIVGEIFGNPWWFADPGTKCWIDNHFVRHCPVKK